VLARFNRGRRVEEIDCENLVVHLLDIIITLRYAIDDREVALSIVKHMLMQRCRVRKCGNFATRGDVKGAAYHLEELSEAVRSCCVDLSVGFRGD
jgi:hypothetical protein